MWFILSLIAIMFWGGSDLFSKMGSEPTDKYSHWKIVVAVGTVMGLHATFEILTGTKFYPIDFIKYLPASALYIGSMILGYVGLRYLMLSVSSPICNSSGAVACILCLIFLRDMPDGLTWVGIVLVVIGVIGLSLAEKANDDELNRMASKEENQKYRVGFIAILLPIFYCVLDGLGTVADALLLDSGRVNEDSANIAYEYTFLFMAIIAFLYVYVIKKQRFEKKYDRPKWLGAVCETAGQFAYIYALASGESALAAPIISSYCVASVLWSRIFLKEKLSWKHYACILTTVLGIIIMGVYDM